MLDPGTAVWDLAEIVTAQVFLPDEAEGAVVGTDDAQRTGTQPLPQPGAFLFVAQRGGEHDLGAFELWLVVFLGAKQQVVGTGFTGHRPPLNTRLRGLPC